ncbi:hypothetical protein FACS1894126_2590 [Alphaproteobacteria bacterium]|nr:hypothetical protein FACS1894126_2590 [Alphaproteobacteria bacterium]
MALPPVEKYAKCTRNVEATSARENGSSVTLVASKDLGAFTESVAKMSTAFDMTAEEAGNAMAQLSNVFQIPITELTQLGDAVNHLSNNTAAKAKDIVPALNRAGGSVRQFGLSAQHQRDVGSA